MSKRAAIYLRVSTNKQTTENQKRELEHVAQKSGWEIAKVYQDKGYSGAKSRDERPAFKALCEDAKRRKFDIVMAWSVDRLGRSLQDLVGFLNELRSLNIDLFIHKQGMDTTTPSGKAMFQMIGVFAEFEREIIKERVRAGLERAKAQGKKLGRPALGEGKEEEVRALREEGHSIRKIAEQTGISVGSVHNILNPENA